MFRSFWVEICSCSLNNVVTLKPLCWEFKEWSWGQLKQMLENKSNKLRERLIMWHREEGRELMRCSKFVLPVLIKNIWIWKQERREGKGGPLLCWHHWPVFSSYYLLALEGFLGDTLPPTNKTTLMRWPLTHRNIWQNNRLCWTATKGNVSWAGW